MALCIPSLDFEPPLYAPDLFRVLRFLISAKLKKYIFWNFFRSYSPTSPSYSPTRLQTKIQILIYLLTSIFTVQFLVGFNLLILCKMRMQLVNDFSYFCFCFSSVQPKLQSHLAVSLPTFYFLTWSKYFQTLTKMKHSEATWNLSN